MKKTFNEYLKIKQPTHINNVYKKMPVMIEDAPNMILYGPKNTNLYEKALYIISKYSDSKLNYEKKINITINNVVYGFKMSDCHFEFDFELSSCNTKSLWHEFITFIIDIIKLRKCKSCFIICKHFHLINQELLNLFYSYMQEPLYDNYCFKMILLSEHVSFIPYSIKSRCYTIANNTKNRITYKNEYLNYERLNKPFIDMIGNKITFSDIREEIYNLLIYNIDVTDCFYHLIVYCIENKKIDKSHISELCNTLYYYQNNYRHIYHLEFFVVSLLKITNEL